MASANRSSSRARSLRAIAGHAPDSNAARAWRRPRRRIGALSGTVAMTSPVAGLMMVRPLPERRCGRMAVWVMV